MSVSSQESVDVNTAAPALNSVDATIGTPFDTAQIQTLPFQSSNIQDLLALQGGVVFMGDANENSSSDTRAGAVNGARSDQNNITMDGVDNNIPTKGYAFLGALRATRDSLEEFRVVTTNSNADAGRSSGAQIALVTRSGTNKLHGSVYDYFRPTNTVSNDFYNKKSQLTSGLPNRPPKYIRDLFGASLGLPLMKDKLFFFGAYEGQKTAISTVVTDTVPTASLTQGMLKYTNASNGTTTLSRDDLAKMDPKCGANGTCPLGAGANSAALAYFALYPTSNSTTKGDGLNTTGYTFTSPSPTSQATTIARIDFAPNARHRIFVRGNLQQDNSNSAESFPGNPPSTKTYDNSRGIAAGDVWTISSSMVNNLRYGFTRFGDAVRGNINSQYVSFSSLTALASNTTSQIAIVPSHNVVDDVSWSKGKHNLQFGGNYRAIFDNHSTNSTIFKNASVATGNLVAGGIANTGSSLDPGAFGYDKVSNGFVSNYNTAVADVTGLITMGTNYANYSISNGALTPLPQGVVPTRNFFSNEAEYYAQDSWKVKRNLTLTFGVRHTLLQVPYERNAQQVVPSFSLNNWFNQRVAAAAAGGVNQPPISFTQGGQVAGKAAYWQMDKLDIAPRFAFAWSPNPTLSVRGGYGLYYDHFGSALVDALDQRGSFGLASTLSNGASQYVDTAPRFSAINNVPSAVLPPISNPGAFPVTPPNSLLTAWVLDDKIKTPYSHVFDLSVQQEMSKGLVFELNYVGRLGRRLLQQLDLAEPLNVVDPKSGQDYYSAATQLSKYVDQGITTAQAASIPTIAYFDNEFPLAGAPGLTPTQNIYKSKWVTDRGNETEALFELDTGISPGPAGGATYRYFNPQYVNLVGFTSIGTSSYHSLQASLHHPMSHGLQYDVNYTFAKSLDMGSDGERVASANSRGYGQIISSFNPKLNKAVSDFDVRHNLSVNAIDTLPFGRGQKFGNQVNRFVDLLIGRWTITGIAHVTSGLPFAAYDGKGWSTNFDVRSWMVPTGPINSGGHKLDAKENPNAFSNVTTALANLRLPYPGETGARNAFRGDGYFEIDTGVNKIFTITDRQQLKFAWEVFNATNTNRFDPKSISNNANSASSFGEYSTLLTQYRNMQFSLRYSF
ncbi:TonB-dependent receptor [Granulicella sp. WH15]|uniref:TonB-dependent receptor domain-containing protein n=1 Tax=Granulicella sp. WH15 TaxID=2602070 RepID=UPI002101E61B|nr:TonB-dependent receptor [Granulicella sp. WH15]